jgi:ABC-2 type transport system ATP-binding protein
VTIIDRGKTKYSGSMDNLLHHQADHPIYRLRLDEDPAEYEERLRQLAGVLEVARSEGKPEYRITLDREKTDQNTLLRGIIDLGAPVMSFQRDQRHLNEAFMDLTERGVRN